jgi:hypothetical protein
VGKAVSEELIHEGKKDMTSRLLVFACALALGGCAAQRAMEAQDAQSKMVGLSKEHVLGCMGVPANRAAEGQTEVWTYNSGDGRTIGMAFSQGTSTASGTVSGSILSAAGSSSGTSFGTSFRLHCTVSVVMTNGRVSRVNYSGPTGGLITQGEQCAYAVHNCLR